MDDGPRERVTFSIPLNPFRQARDRTLAAGTVTTVAFVQILMTWLGVLAMGLASAVLWWVADQLGRIHWIVSLPVLIPALIFGLYATFYLLGAILQTVLIILAALWGMLRAIAGRAD